jgi:two-component system invasion response regulator UvrY
VTGTDDVTGTAGAARIRMLLSLLPGVEVGGTSADGEEALTVAAELKPDVVLMDLRMPGIGGMEATADCARQTRRQA